MLLFELIFWFSLFAIFYAFIGYLLVLRALSLLMPKPLKGANADFSPTVSLLISAYNEEEVIRAKLNNALELDYPQDKLEIIVISDASTDRTERIVNEFKSKGVRLIQQPIREGKTAALNLAVPQANGEIVVFSDANSMYNSSAILQLVKPFKVPEIGFVTGTTKYVSDVNGMTAESTGIYSRLEMETKILESRIGSCVGADGAIVALRKSLYQPLAAGSINDFVIPLNVVKKGYRGIIEPKAFCVENTARDLQGEFRRQVRITVRSIRAIVDNLILLNPLQYPLFSFELISHKIFKFKLPFFMMALFISNVLIASSNIFYAAILLAQVLFYAFAGYGAVSNRKGIVNRIGTMAYSFGMVSCALLVGWVKFFSGETYLTWNSER